TKRCCDDRGSATIWMIGVTVAAFLMIGLVLDGGVMLRARSDAFAVAGAAARVGAQQLDSDAAVEGEAVLDPVAAEQAALAHLAANGVTGSVVVTGDTVRVTVTTTADLQLLSLVGGGSATFEATAEAQAVKVVPS
ncbi:MAG TPA: pilus assembly protein TadG-related protein, partial [Ilumatobacteraceae bacterium]|nr:pilus assembly protein TadG-related protein [Ilumatobacteraceae bacterium]